MNFIKPLAIALPVAIGSMLSVATVAQSGDYSDVSAAFAAEFSIANKHLDAVNTVRDDAIAANDALITLDNQTDTTHNAYVNAVDGLTIDTVDESINAAVLAYKNALTEYNTAENTADSYTSSATFSSVDLAITEVERLRTVLQNAGIAAVSAREAADLVTQATVEGVTQEQIDYAELVVDFGDTARDSLEFKKSLPINSAHVSSFGNVDIPVTDGVMTKLENIDVSQEDHVTLDFDDAVFHDKIITITIADIKAIRVAHKVNTQIAFYDDEDNNNGQEITADHITAAEAMVLAGPIVDVTAADIAKATQTLIDGPIEESVILAAQSTVLENENYVAAVTANDGYAIDSTVSGDSLAVVPVGIGTDTITVDASIRNAAAAWADDSRTVDGKIITEVEAQELVDAYNNQQKINAYSTTDKELAQAVIDAERTEITDDMITKARAKTKGGLINVLTQAEFEAAGKFVNEMAGVKTAVEAMEAAEAALVDAIEKSDDEAIKSASKALESATTAIKNIISINNKVATAISDVDAGRMSIKHFNEKIKPDAGVAVSGALSGVAVVNNTITNHQNTVVASSGKYGLAKHSGVNAGSALLNMGVWLKAFGSDSEMDMRDSVAGYDANTHGVVIGVDQVIGNDFLVGMALSFADTDVEGKSTAKSITDTDQIQGTLYGTLFMNDFFINGSVAYAHASSDTERTGFGGVVTGEYDTSTYSASVGAGMPIDMESYAITPQITLAYSHVNPDEYKESGFGALNVNPDSMDLFGIKAGVTLNKKLIFDGGTLSPKLRLIADWDVLQEKALVNSSWVSTGTTVTPTGGPKPAAFGGIIGAGVDYTTDDGAYVFSLDYDLSTRSDFVSHAASAQFRLNF